MKTSPKTIDDYLALLPADQRKALTAARRTIKTTVPDATEYIGYGLAGFKLDGKPLIYLGAMKQHVAIYGPAVVPFAAELKGYTTTKGSVHFTAEKPLPRGLLAKMVKARAGEIRAKRRRA